MEDERTVAVVSCEDYLPDNVETAVRSSLDIIGGMNKFVSKGDRVLIKPNMLMASAPESAVTTHPSVISAIVKLVLEVGGLPLVGDSPGGRNNRMTIDAAYGRTGLRVAAEEAGAEVIHLSTEERVAFPEGMLIKSFVLAREVLEVDKIIVLPKLKTHSLTTLTCAVKNLYGIIPGLHKAKYHLRLPDGRTFSRMLIDLNRCVPAHLYVVDGVVGMEGEGPSAGSPKKAGLMVAGASPYCVDAVVCDLVGIPRKTVPTVEFSEELGLLDGLEMLDHRAEHVEVIFSLPKTGFTRSIPTFFRVLFRRSFNLYPDIIHDVCTLCETCARACPAEALSVKNKKLRLDHSECIRCYVCQELCPEKAIVLRPPVLMRMAERFLGFIDRVKGKGEDD